MHITYLCLHIATETFKAKLKNWSETQRKLDVMSTKAKLKQCDTIYYCQTTDPVRLGEQDIGDRTEFTYLGAKVTKDGNTEVEIKTRINKARGACAALKNIWKTKMISKKTKIRIFKSNVLSVLLYAAYAWKVTKGIFPMLEVFQNK